MGVRVLAPFKGDGVRAEGLTPKVLDGRGVGWLSLRLMGSELKV